jgi:glycosyltransferase involved in cell wall biosynthesis
VHRLRGLCENAALRRALGERARLHVRETRDWTRIAKRYEAIYEAARSRRGRKDPPRM